MLLTLLRGVNAALLHGLQWAGARVPFLQGRRLAGQRRARHAIVAGLALIVAVGPFLISNEYTEAPAYQVYLAEARGENIFTATLLDWAIHVQPVIYRLVGPAG